MILDLLKKELSEELYTQVSKALEGKDLGQFIPKARFDEVNNSKKELEIKVKDLDKYADYDEIKSKVAQYGDYEELKKKNDELVLGNKKQSLVKMGLDESFVDYALGKIDPANFEENAKKFITDNPKFTAETFSKINSSLDLGGKGKIDPEKLTSQEYIDWRKTHLADGSEINRK